MTNQTTKIENSWDWCSDEQPLLRATNLHEDDMDVGSEVFKSTNYLKQGLEMMRAFSQEDQNLFNPYHLDLDIPSDAIELNNFYWRNYCFLLTCSDMLIEKSVADQFEGKPHSILNDYWTLNATLVSTKRLLQLIFKENYTEGFATETTVQFVDQAGKQVFGGNAFEFIVGRLCHTYGNTPLSFLDDRAVLNFITSSNRLYRHESASTNGNVGERIREYIGYIQHHEDFLIKAYSADPPDDFLEHSITMDEKDRNHLLDIGGFFPLMMAYGSCAKTVIDTPWYQAWLGSKMGATWKGGATALCSLILSDATLEDKKYVLGIIKGCVKPSTFQLWFRQALTPCLRRSMLKSLMECTQHVGLSIDDLLTSSTTRNFCTHIIDYDNSYHAVFYLKELLNSKNPELQETLNEHLPASFLLQNLKKDHKAVKQRWKRLQEFDLVPKSLSWEEILDVVEGVINESKNKGPYVLKEEHILIFIEQTLKDFKLRETILDEVNISEKKTKKKKM